jgi:hypothetical protein
MIESSLITKEEVGELLEQAGVVDTASIDRAAFEAFVDELVDEDEDEEE